MKHLLMLLALGTLFSTLAFAEETTTDCPQMREDTSRHNPKANTAAVKSSTKVKTEGSAE